MRRGAGIVILGLACLSRVAGGAEERLTVVRAHRSHDEAGPHDDHVSALAWDGETLWVGTFDAGVARLRQGIWDAPPIGGSPRHRWINALCWDGETLWVGSVGGLARWQPDLRSFEGLGELDGAIHSIRHHSGTLVVAGSDRVWLRRGSGWQTIELPGESLHTAFVDRGAVWAGGLWGAVERRPGGWRRYSELNGRLPDSWVTALLPVDDGMWAGTYDAGLFILRHDGPPRPLLREAWINANALRPIAGGVAVGTMGDGLLLWSRSTGRWRRLTTANGLPSDDVTAVAETAGTLWVGTRSGLAELRRGGR